MSQYLSTCTVVALYHLADERRHFLTTKSLIKSKTFLAPEADIKSFQNTLFYIQIDGNNMDINVSIEYDQPICLRHTISQKYLTLTVDQQDEKEMKYRLVLGTQKKYFKINPCYQYQTKISTKIKFNQQIYLSTQYTESRQGMIVVEQQQETMQLFLGFSFGSKLQFHYYSTHEKEEKYYKHGEIVWLSHIESQNFLSLASVNGREEVVFEPIKVQKQIQNMSALWTIESKVTTQSNHLKYEQEIMFKNLLSGFYLSFSKNYRLVDNQRIYQIFLQQSCGQNSKFLFRPIKEKQLRQIDKNSYLSLLHCESNLNLGCRRQKVSQDYFKLLTFPYMEDEDLFKLHSFSNEEEQALRFIVAIRADFKDIDKINKVPERELTLPAVLEIEETYLNIEREFENLKKYEKLFQFVRNELGPSIRIIASNLSFFRSISDAPASSSHSSKSQKMKALSSRILTLAYHILCIFCQKHSPNQSISFEYLSNYLMDVGDRVGAQEAIMETFRNNKMLLPKTTISVSKEGNVVRVLLTEFHKKNPEKNLKYWQNLQKIIAVLNVLIFHNGHPLDVNQNLISQQLFKNGFYERIILPIKVQGPRIVILDPETNRYTPIENLTNPQVNAVVELLLLLFSNLTDNHSYNSKKYIHSYLSENNQACLSVLIAYLNKPIRKQLYNQLLNFVSKTYLDSSPRLKRIKPLPFIFFHFQQEKSHAEQEQGFMSERLKEMMMLRMEESKVCKPLHYSNLLPVDNSIGSEPSMNEEQLVSFRLSLTENILNNKNVSENQLETINLLMQLECYTTNEMLQIYEELKRKLLVKDTSEKLQKKILAIINQIYLLLQELQTKKLTIYLKHKFVQNQQEDLKESEYKYMLPLSTRVHIPLGANQAQAALPQQELLDSSRYEASDNLISDYNELRDTVTLMHAKPELKKALVAYFCNFKEGKLLGEQAEAYLQSLFNIILKTHLPKYKFLLFLSKSTVLTHEEVFQFDHLFSTSKKLQYLILISDYWMVGDNQPESCQQFLRYMSELTNFLYQEYDVKIPEGFQRKSEDISTKRQLFVNSLGVHQMVLEILEKNSYLVIHAETKKDIPRKLKDIFQACFLFLFCFIKQCSENKRSIEDFFPVLLLYQNCIQLGQLRVYTQFFRDEKGFVKELNFNFVQNIVNRIVRYKSDGKTDFCEYDPDYLQLLIVMIHSLDIESKSFVDKLYNFISKQDIFNRLLFIGQSKDKKQTVFCLKMHKIKLDPLQLPLLYHHSLLSLFLLILSKSTESIKNSFKLKLTQTLKISYLFEILALPDTYSNTGISPLLNFILKEKVLQLIWIFLEKTQLAPQIYESDSLTELLQFWTKIFINKAERKEMSNESQSFYLPFLQRLGDNAMQNDKSLYYHTHVKPFLEKLVVIFQKQKIHGKVRELSPRNFLFPLNDTLRDEFKDNFRPRKTSFFQNYQLKDVKLKWRNFVDDDEDNSKEEKYVKKAILDILKSKKSADFIAEQLHSFYRVIQENCKPFISSMVTLLKILFSSKSITEGRMPESKTVVKVLKYLSEYIQYRSVQSSQASEYNRKQQISLLTSTLEECKFIQIFIDLASKKEFQLRKIHLKTIFYYCLKIVNFMLQHEQEQKFSRLLFKIFKQNSQSYQFLEFLKEGALEIISTIDPLSHLEQINSALNKMSLCIDVPPIHLHQQSYLTLAYMCRHEPFTFYLRNQQSAFADTDFLDKIYNILLFLFKNNDHHSEFSQSITISSVRAAEHILDFTSSMMIGPNGPNQNFLIDNKYAQFVLKVLKLDDLPPSQYQFKTQRGELLEKIIQFYKSNGIEISQLLQSRINLFDFRHSYLLNRFKTILVKSLLECLIANENNLVRVKMDIPVEIIKLNFIWVYEAYRKGKYQYKEALVLRGRDDWNALIEKDVDIDSLFLRLGFYYYQLIDLYEDKDAGESLESDEKIINEEKEKQRVVKKFFGCLMEKSRQKDKENSLESEQMREEMKYYYHTYYNAVIFFRKKTGTIEVDLKGNIIKVYFPKLPIAEKITEEMEQEFKIGVKRVSRDQKIKSLIEYENQFYEDLKGEEDYFNEIERRMPLLGPVLRMMKYEDQFMLAALIISFLITILYLLANYQSPTFEFTAMFFHYIGFDGTFSSFIMLLLSVVNLLIGLLIGVYLFTRKIPLRKKLLSLKFALLQLKDKGKEDTPTNQTVYIWSSIAQEIAYNLYIVIFLLLTIAHPFFSAFPLIEIINRIEMGRFIIKSIKETWPQLLVAVGLLIIFNVIFVQIFYGFYTSATGYGTMCESQQTCFKLLIDQNLKGGAGALGNVDSDYTRMVLNSQVLAEIIYIIMSLKVIAQIFSGTIIDKFSQLREQQQKIEEDQKKICLICGQQRFDLDLEYQGFGAHTEENHFAFNYIKYLFYLRRCQPREYGIIERYIQEQRLKQIEKWIPQDNSLAKQLKLREEEKDKQEEQDIKDTIMGFVRDKVKDMKRVRQKVEVMAGDLKRQNRKAVEALQ